MLTIWKSIISPIAYEFEIEMPSGAKVLSVQVQHDQPCIWFLCNPKRDKITRRFRIYGTGHPIESLDGYTFVDTFQIHGGRLVWHLFVAAIK